jgi:hypothetical protein
MAPASTGGQAMSVSFQHQPHARITARSSTPPPTRADENVGVNGRIALALTAAVGTMWCAYLFAGLALIALPEASGGGVLALVQWLSQTFIQLVMLSVIMVGQNIVARAADRRSMMTYLDTEATFHETGQLQAHLAAQDDAINSLLQKLEAMEAANRGG